jgi:hypothetical protein
LTQNVAKMSDRARVFLSHSSADRKVAADIAKHLADSGVQVWTDAMINPGENFVSAIESAIKDSDFLVLLVGDDLLSSRNVMYELGFAASEQRTRNVTLLPALLPGASDKSMPAYLRRFPSIDGREMSEEEVAEKIADQIVMATNGGAAAAGSPG